MSKQSKVPLELGKRERQIYETIMGLGEASVSEVLEHLPDPPSYSAVRATMNLLAEKEWLRFRQEGQKYIYRVAASDKARKTAAERLLSTFFGGSALNAVAALLDASSSRLSDEELRQMASMIENARKEKRS